MNVLIINQYAGSPKMGMEFRHYYLAQEWLKAGYNVRIVTGEYSHLRMKNPKICRDFTSIRVDGIIYTFLKTGKYTGKGSSRAVSVLKFLTKLYFHAKRIAEYWKPDVVIASSTYQLDTYAAQKIARYASAVLIHEVHDMWPLFLTEIEGMHKYHPFVCMVQAAENSFCRNSDYVVSLPCCAKDYFIRHGMKPEKFVPASNGVVLEEWEHGEEVPEPQKGILLKLKRKHKFIICFFGTLSDYYALDILVRAVQKLGNEKITVVFIGEGPKKQELRRLSEKKLQGSFLFLDKIPKNSIPTMLGFVDALYVGGVKNSVFRYGIAMNKLFDAMMSGKPILYAVDAPNNYIQNYQCGISVAPEDVNALSAAISRLYCMKAEERQKLGENGRKAVTEHFNYKVLAADFAKLF